MKASSRSRHSRVALAVVASMTVGTLSGCGSTSSVTSGTQGIPATVKLLAIHDETGLGAVSAKFQDRGMRLAIKQVNDSHFLGKSKLSVSIEDTDFEPQVAANLETQAVVDKSVVAVMGPLNSGEAAAIAPIANKGKLPTLVQTSSDNLTTGQYVYQDTAPFSAFYYKGLAYLKTKSVKTVSVLYASDSEVYANVATKIVAGDASKYGYRIKSSTGVPSTTTDFTAPVTKLLDDNSGAVILSIFGAGIPTVVKDLRQGGYKGIILANTAASAGALTPAGHAGVGVAWPTDFSAASNDPNARKFVKAYEAAYDGQSPADWAASAYDGVWQIARAIKASGNASRAGIAKGLEMVAHSGFTGAEGHITFAGNVYKVPGLVVGWTGSAEKEIP